MRLINAITTLAFLLLSSTSYAACNNLLDYEARKLHSKETIDLCKAYQDKVIVIVNTASQCGYTPQFKALEQLHQRYKDQGLVVLGFPSNDFNQEYSDETQTANVCYVNYGVSFPVFAPSSVTGNEANPVFKQLAAQTGTAPNWNFNKYVVDKDGKAIKAFRSKALPLGGELEETVKQALGL